MSEMKNNFQDTTMQGISLNNKFVWQCTQLFFFTENFYSEKR